MNKFLKKMLLLALLSAPWATQAQTLQDYTFATGEDASRWITLSDTAISVFNGYADDAASSIFDIGFTFPLGEDSYSQFWVNSNGAFSFNATTNGSSSSSQLSQYSYDQYCPKILGAGKDMGTGSNGYVKYELVGEAPSRVLVCEYALGNTWGSDISADVLWQVQLHEDSAKVVIVYGPTAPTTVPSYYYTGISLGTDDVVVVDPTSHQASYSYASSGYTTWQGANRYYEFTRPVITCPKPANLSCMPDTADLHLSWTPMGEESEWIIYVNGEIVGSSQTNSYTVSNLEANTQYDVAVRAYCLMDDTSLFLRGSYRTACSQISLPFFTSFENDPYGEFPPCWTRTLASGTDPSVNTVFAHTGLQSMYLQASYDYNLFASQVVPTAGNNIKVDFWARLSSDNEGWIQAGVMTNPNEDSTFIPLLYINDMSGTWKHYNFSTHDLDANESYYVAFKYYGTASWNAGAGAIDDITIDVTDGCAMVRNAAFDSIDSTFVTISWTPVPLVAAMRWPIIMPRMSTLLPLLATSPTSPILSPALTPILTITSGYAISAVATTPQHGTMRVLSGLFARMV